MLRSGLDDSGLTKRLSAECHRVKFALLLAGCLFLRNLLFKLAILFFSLLVVRHVGKIVDLIAL